MAACCVSALYAASSSSPPLAPLHSTVKSTPAPLRPHSPPLHSLGVAFAAAHALAALDDRQAKVAQLVLPVAADVDVVGLDVQVQDVALVHVLQRRSHLRAKVKPGEWFTER